MAPLHTRFRDALRRARRRLAAPVEIAVRQDLALQGEELSRVRAQLEALAAQRSSERLAFEAALSSERQEREAALTRERQEREAALEREWHGRQRLWLLEAALAGTAEALVLRGKEPRPTGGRPRVSVVLPTRDRAQLVVRAIRSVLAQSFADWELIVVDDGSEDGTAQALEPFLADPRVRVLRTPRQGQSPARNLALREAQGDLIAYLDSDNLMFPGFLEGVVAAFDADPDLETGYGILVSDAAYVEGSRILWRPFDRKKLLEANTIDLGAFVHRRALVEALGGFDESLRRLGDWDLMLRYTERRPARALEVLSAYYRTRVAGRVTDTHDVGSSWFRVRRKWLPRSKAPGPRVLYAVWHYPQITESYMEAELQAARRHGVEVEVWTERGVSVPYPTSVKIHSGSLAAALDAFRPEVVHAHWISSALHYEPEISSRGLPMTVRAHGFDGAPANVEALLSRPGVRRLYLFPHQAGGLAGSDRVRTLRSAFDTQLFQPEPAKDRRLVVRTAAALPAKDLGFFLELARAAPTHRFVLVAATATDVEGYPGELRELARRLGSPAELRFNLSREETAALVARAGVYLHTALPPDQAGGTPIGMPISIAEAMATGAYVLVRALAPLVEYVGTAGAVYRDLDEAARLVRATMDWTDADWLRARRRAVDRAFFGHADETTLWPLIEDWRALAAEQARPVGRG